MKGTQREARDGRASWRGTPRSQEVLDMLTCGKCNQSVDRCICPDQDARLRWASDSEHVLFKWCRTCDKHYARCQCSVPDFGIRTGGVIHAPEYLDTARTLNGYRVAIHPHKRP